MIVDSINTWAQVILAVLGLLGALIAAFRFFILKPLVRLIDERTKEIQPGSNGGWSLSDVHRRIDKIEERFDSLEQSHKEILNHVTKPVRRTKQTPPQV